MGENSKVLSYCFVLHFLHCSSRGRSKNSSSNGRRRWSPPKGPFGSLPLRRRKVLLCRWPLRSRFTPTVWRLPRGKTHDHVTRKRQPSEGEVPDRRGSPSSRWRDLRTALCGRRRHTSSSSSTCYLTRTPKPPSEVIDPDSIQRTPGQYKT
jgi:hypothetical protein